MIRLLKRWSLDQSGATAIEYGLIATLICLAIIGGVTALAGANNNKYNAISSAIGNAM